MTAHWPTPAGLHTASAGLPVEGELPSFGGATGWLNSPPLAPAGLGGNVVLAGFWTYTCINWLRQLPYLRAGLGNIPATGWSSSACTHPSWHSSTTPATSAGPCRTCNRSRSRLTTTTRYEVLSATTTGRLCTSPTRSGAVGVELPAEACVQLLCALDIRDGDDDYLQLHIGVLDARDPLHVIAANLRRAHSDLPGWCQGTTLALRRLRRTRETRRWIPRSP